MATGVQGPILGPPTQSDSFFGSILGGISQGIDTAGEFLGNAAGQIIPIGTQFLFESQIRDKLVRPTFVPAVAPPTITQKPETAGAMAKGPFGLSGEVDTTTLVLISAVVIGGMIIAVKV